MHKMSINKKISARIDSLSKSQSKPIFQRKNAPSIHFFKTHIRKNPIIVILKCKLESKECSFTDSLI